MKLFGIGHRLRGPLRLGAIAAALVLVVSACGGGSGTSAPAGPAPATHTALKVTTLNLCNEITVYWAQDKGIFGAHGLDVSLVKSSGGAAALAALQGGAVDVAFTNPFSAILAAKQGLALKWIGNAYEYPTSEQAATSGLFVKQDSPIQRPRDLAGKTVATNEVGGTGQFMVEEFVSADGGNPSLVKFTNLPFSQMVDAVKNGQIDAASLPLQNVAGATGIRSIGDPHVGATQGKPTPYAGYVVTGTFFSSKQDVAKAFYDSLVAADQAINDPANANAKFALESAKCGQSASALAATRENPYVPDVDMAGMRRLAEILVKHGQLTQQQVPDLNALVADFAKKPGS